jgi:hypothetical protein
MALESSKIKAHFLIIFISGNWCISFVFEQIFKKSGGRILGLPLPLSVSTNRQLYTIFFALK